MIIYSLLDSIKAWVLGAYKNIDFVETGSNMLSDSYYVDYCIVIETRAGNIKTDRRVIFTSQELRPGINSSTVNTVTTRISTDVGEAKRSLQEKYGIPVTREALIKSLNYSDSIDLGEY